jgi:GxxExxY protein
MEITQKYINDIVFKIVGCTIEVHKEFGPGLLESLYEESLILELRSQGLRVVNQQQIIPFYKGNKLETRLRFDLLVEDLILVENKSVESLHPIDTAQLLSYMKITKKPKGILINYNVLNIVKEGLVPLVNEYFRELPKE